MIQYRAQAPAKEKFSQLFEKTGWNDEYHQTPEELHRAIRNSWYALSAHDGEQLVGFGRLVADEVSHAMIYDLIVDPAYRGQGIGTEILAQLVQKCLDAGIRDIQLFCAKGKRSFYEKRGFVARRADAPGMAYLRED
jgi:GNAT superfamily N-acetyltransferase